MIADFDVQIACRTQLLTLPGLPAARAWENAEFTPVAGVPYVEEEYLPGGRDQRGCGKGGRMEFLPTYVVFVHHPANTKLAARKSADAVLLHFPPGLVLPLGSPPPDKLNVRQKPAPYARPTQPSAPGFVTIPVVIPLRVYTSNII